VISGGKTLHRLEPSLFDLRFCIFHPICDTDSGYRRLATEFAMGRIHVLSETVANQIAAGEVEAFCGRDPERREGVSPQPKSRAKRGISSHG
jgi:hypothetical protein